MNTSPSPYDIFSVPTFRKDLPFVWNIQRERNPVTVPAPTAVPTPTPPAQAAPAAGSPTATLDKLIELHGILKAVPRAFLTVLAEAGSGNHSLKYEALREAGAAASNDPGFTYYQVRGNLAWLTKGLTKVNGAPVSLFKFSLVDMKL